MKRLNIDSTAFFLDFGDDSFDVVFKLWTKCQGQDALQDAVLITNLLAGASSGLGDFFKLYLCILTCGVRSRDQGVYEGTAIFCELPDLLKDL